MAADSEPPLFAKGGEGPELLVWDVARAQRLWSQECADADQAGHVHGVRFVKASLEERKVIWREQLLKLRLFRDLYELLLKQPKHEIDRTFLLETFIMNMPQENYETMFQTFIRWARWGDLFAYDDVTEMISLEEEKHEG